MCSASLLFQVLAGMGEPCLSRSLLETTSRARSLESPHRIHCLKLFRWTGMGCFSLVCVLQHFISSLGSRCKLDGRNLRVRVASTAFGWDADVCVGGVGWVARVSGVFSHHQRRQACVSVCQRGGRMRNRLGVVRCMCACSLCFCLLVWPAV